MGSPYKTDYFEGYRPCDRPEEIKKLQAKIDDLNLKKYLEDMAFIKQNNKRVMESLAIEKAHKEQMVKV